MKHFVFALIFAASTVAATAQTASKPAAPKAATTPKTAASASKLPPGIPPVKAPIRTIFTVSLRYQDIKVGTGPLAEPGKLFKVQYTGWRAADGVKFDSSYDHRAPMFDKDRKPILGPDGKPKFGEAQPMPFVQGRGGAIPGFDQGFVGMHVGGKRRMFIPWQMAYGTREIPDRGPEHPGIPAKSDLIFDVELVDVTDLPAPPMRPNMPPMHPSPAPRPGATQQPSTPPPSAQPSAAPQGQQATPPPSSTPATKPQ